MSLFTKESKVIVHYFNARGRAEVIRYILLFANAPFEDRRIEREQWPAIKPTMPLSQLPVLELVSADGNRRTIVTQHASIVRSLAQLHGLAGKTLEESTRADEAYESLKEVVEAMMKAWSEKDADKKKELMEQLVNEHIPRIFGYLEKLAVENKGKGIAGGDAYTYADLDVAQLTADVFAMIPGFDQTKVAEKYPHIGAIVKDINETPSIKAYLATRPKTAF